MSKAGAEEIHNLGTILFFDPLYYTSRKCTFDFPPTAEGHDMDLKEYKDDKLIGVYIKLRAKRDAEKKLFTDGQKKTLEAMENIQGEMARRFKERGVTNTTCKGVGSAYVKTDTSVTVKDWSAFFEFVMGNDAYDLLERRAAKTAVMEYVENNQQLPPGLAMVQEEVVLIRAPTGG